MKKKNMALVERGENGAWPKKLSDEKIDALWDDITAMLLKHFDRDADGDFPVNIHIVDRTECQMMHYVPVPYAHKETPIERCLEVALLNLNMAMSEYTQLVQLKAQRDKRGGICKRCDIPTNDGYDHAYKSECVKAIQVMRARLNKAEERLQK